MNPPRKWTTRFKYAEQDETKEIKGKKKREINVKLAKFPPQGGAENIWFSFFFAPPEGGNYA
jgi:hypothetical protein